MPEQIIKFLDAKVGTGMFVKYFFKNIGLLR